MGKTLRVQKLAVIRYPNALGGFSFYRSSELQAHHLLCDKVSLPLRLFVCISHCSESDSVSNHDFYSVIFKYFTYCFLYCVPNICSFGLIKAFDSKQIHARTCKDYVISREINTLLKMALFGKSCWNVDTRKMLRSVLKRLFFLVLSKRWLRREY